MVEKLNSNFPALGSQRCCTGYVRASVRGVGHRALLLSPGARNFALKRFSALWPAWLKSSDGSSATVSLNAQSQSAFTFCTT